MSKSSILVKGILISLAIIIGLVINNTLDTPQSITTTQSGITTKPSATIYPVERLNIYDDLEYGVPERQRVSLFLSDPNRIETLIISTDDSNGSSELYKWVAVEANNSRISKLTGSFENQLYISYQDKTVFSTHDLIYDYINFHSVCTGPDKRQRMLFSLIRGGSANGNIQDMLFVYYDKAIEAFRHKVIERRYLPNVCDMEGAPANQAEQEQQLKNVNLIHEKLRPSLGDTDLHDHVASQQTLPIRQFSNTQLEAILAEYKRLVPDAPEHVHERESLTSDNEDDYENFYEPELVVTDLAENANWRIVEVLYLQLYNSWGVLLAENKNTSQWTAFYTIYGGGDSKRHLYFSDEVELVESELRGNFTVYGDQKLSISLDDFTVKNATRTKL